MPATPHLALPFRFQNGHAATNDQDSIDDVTDCVVAILSTRPGERDELPDFGVEDPTFDQRPLNVDRIAGQVAAWEPRAHLAAEEHPDLYDVALDRARITVATEQ